MRLSVLALLFTLPAAAYAVVCPQQHSIDFGYECGERGGFCNSDSPCCGRLECKWNGFGGVCFIAHLLRFALGTKLNTGMQLRLRTRFQ